MHSTMTPHGAKSDELIKCHECDLLQRKVALPGGTAAICCQCGAKLYGVAPDIDRVLAVAIAAAIFFIIANVTPLMGIQMQATKKICTLPGAVVTLWQQGFWSIAILVLLTAIILPAVELGLTVTLFTALKLHKKVPALTFIMRSLRQIEQWVMVEVFMLGLLVTLVKLTHFATIIPGIALWSFAALTVLMAALAAQIDLHAIWELAAPSVYPDRSSPSGNSGTLISCHLCGLVSKSVHTTEELFCPRCLEPLHFRKNNSISNAWALLLAAYIAYLPANILPIMDTGSLFGTQSDTIMSGVLYLWKSGSWDLALIVFVASIMVPLLKLLVMTFLLISVQRNHEWSPLQRTRLYRMVELVGKWSMLDIYVVTILAAIVQIGSLATITVGNGAIAFGFVVVLTMFAALQFDPRLIWEPYKKEHPLHD